MLGKFKKKLGELYVMSKQRLKTQKDQIFGDHNYKKFVIISDSRTGSTLLMDYLNSHPNIIALGEEFRDLGSNSCQNLWNAIFRKKSKKIKGVGFKLFYHHPRNKSDQLVWNLIEKDKSILIIHLTRTNLLRSYISKEIGLKTKKWTENINSNDNIDIKEKKININPVDCLISLNMVVKNINKTNKRFRNHNLISVKYENLINRREEVLNLIFEELNVEKLPVTSKLKKQNPENLQDLVLNYDELKKHFSNTRWKFCFKENGNSLTNV